MPGSRSATNFLRVPFFCCARCYSGFTSTASSWLFSICPAINRPFFVALYFLAPRELDSRSYKRMALPCAIPRQCFLSQNPQYVL